MKITLKELKDLNACIKGYETFKASHPAGEATLLQALDSNGLDDILWYLDNTKQLSDQQKADVDAWTRKQALKVAHLIESDQKDLIIHFLKTGEDREAAMDAAWAAAWAAAGAAMAAARAAGAAAWEARAAARAAGAAAWEARAAAGEARAAAWEARAAAWAAAGAAMAAARAAKEKQLRELREMLERWEQQR